MSAASTLVESRSSVARLTAIGGGSIFLLLLAWDIYLYGSIYLALPAEVPLQYIASGALGLAAFEGGLGTALLGLAIHLFISIVVAAVFVVAASQMPALRDRAILGGIVYGLGVRLFMVFVVIPMSATPKSDPDLVFWISSFASHLLALGLVLGVLVQRSRVWR